MKQYYLAQHSIGGCFHLKDVSVFRCKANELVLQSVVKLRRKNFTKCTNYVELNVLIEKHELLTEEQSYVSIDASHDKQFARCSQQHVRAHIDLYSCDARILS